MKFDSFNPFSSREAEIYEKDSKGTKIVFQFNPETISFTKNAQWNTGKSKSAKDAHLKQFGGSSPMQMSVEMLLDNTTAHGSDVAKRVARLVGWCNPGDERSKATSPAPPVLVFNWGQLKIGAYRQFECHMKSLSVKYTLFDRTGDPLRAQCSVSLQSIGSVDQRQNPTSGAREPNRSMTVEGDDSLPLVSHRHYGKTAPWREVASYNQIDNPFRVRPGSTMILPQTGGPSSRG